MQIKVEAIDFPRYPPLQCWICLRIYFKLIPAPPSTLLRGCGEKVKHISRSGTSGLRDHFYLTEDVSTHLSYARELQKRFSASTLIYIYGRACMSSLHKNINIERYIKGATPYYKNDSFSTKASLWLMDSVQKVFVNIEERYLSFTTEASHRENKNHTRKNHTRIF